MLVVYRIFSIILLQWYLLWYHLDFSENKHTKLNAFFIQKSTTYFKPCKFTRIGKDAFYKSGCEISDFPDLNIKLQGHKYLQNCYYTVAKRLISENKIELFYKFMILMSYNEQNEYFEEL
jgi:hypothetical protein